ncbi:hypothetical protein TanjilG_27895 [Lupinus angustifolius]|uniref:Uncharacterized protein n=1 Tax=Lupinus angustifolius TaxID=3871 RepID=A0A4P1RG44_LUPAN|nr:hypothetical protein TanjilG_27895 [Lupinus angustifolius]
MMKLSSCFCILLLLLSFSLFETRPLRNHDPFSSHSHSSSLFLSTVKLHLNIAKADSKLLAKSGKVSLSIELRNSNGTRTQYYQPLRVSPGGPDGHHHFNTTVGGHGRR